MVLIIDAVMTGLDGYPRDRVLEGEDVNRRLVFRCGFNLASDLDPPTF